MTSDHKKRSDSLKFNWEETDNKKWVSKDDIKPVPFHVCQNAKYAGGWNEPDRKWVSSGSTWLSIPRLNPSPNYGLVSTSRLILSKPFRGSIELVDTILAGNGNISYLVEVNCVPGEGPIDEPFLADVTVSNFMEWFKKRRCWVDHGKIAKITDMEFAKQSHVYKLRLL